jgi:hypothetical protein
VYLSQVLPLAVTVVNNISMYFENYSDLSYVSWKANLGRIVREVNDYQVECVSMTFWCGSGPADPYRWLMDPDPAIYVIDLQDANKKLIFKKSILLITF